MAIWEQSLPVQGAWIEMKYQKEPSYTPVESLPVQGAWIEISRDKRP